MRSPQWQGGEEGGQASGGRGGGGQNQCAVKGSTPVCARGMEPWLVESTVTGMRGGEGGVNISVQ